MSARLSALQSQCDQQRRQQQDALAAVSTCLTAAISHSRDRTAIPPSTTALATVDRQSNDDQRRLDSSSATYALPKLVRASSFTDPSTDSSSSPHSSFHLTASQSVSASTSAPVRLSDLCAEDKARVGRLLVALAQSRAQQQKDSQGRREAEVEERRRWSEENAQLDAQLAESMTAVMRYQERVSEMEQEQRRTEAQGGRRDELVQQRQQQHEDAKLDSSQSGSTSRQQGNVDMAAAAASAKSSHSDQLAARQSDAAAIHRLQQLVTAQQAALTQRLDSIIQQTGVTAHTTPRLLFPQHAKANAGDASYLPLVTPHHAEPHSGLLTHTPADAYTTNVSRSAGVSPAGLSSHQLHWRSGIPPPSASLPLVTSKLSASSPPIPFYSQSSSLAPVPPSFSPPASPHRPSIAVSDRPIGGGQPVGSRRPHNPMSSASDTSADRYHQQHRSAPPSQHQPLTAVRATQHGRAIRAASEQHSSEDQDGDDDDDSTTSAAVAQPQSPVSRRIERLLSIQRGHGSAGTGRHAAAAAVAHSDNSSAVDSDTELRDLLHILNPDSGGGSSSSASRASTTRMRYHRSSVEREQQPAGLRQPSSTTSITSNAAKSGSRLSQFDSSLLAVINAVDGWD